MIFRCTAFKMDTSALKIFFLLSIFRITEVCSKNNKIKIIVPHKISVIHHHHSKMADLEPKRKLHFDLHDMWKSNQIYNREEESEEDVSEEGRFGHYRGVRDEEADASRRGIAYYAFPAPEYSNAVRVYMKPVFLHNDPFDRKGFPRYEYLGYEDYNYPEETYRENSYHIRGFHYK